MDYERRAYLQRWQAVEEVERQELAAATFEQRWQQFNALFQLAAGLGLTLKQDEEEEAIFYQVWARLKEKM